MKEETIHFKNCSAPLCQDADNKEAIWYPGEQICTKTPKLNFQTKQENISRWVSKGNIDDRVYTLKDL